MRGRQNPALVDQRSCTSADGVSTAESVPGQQIDRALPFAGGRRGALDDAGGLAPPAVHIVVRHEGRQADDLFGGCRVRLRTRRCGVVAAHRRRIELEVQLLLEEERLLLGARLLDCPADRGRQERSAHGPATNGTSEHHGNLLSIRSVIEQTRYYWTTSN